MWDLYCKGPAAVAIRSTIGRLKKASCCSPGPIYIAKAHYLDWTKPGTWPNNVFGMLIRKEYSYKHEDEIRMTFWIDQPGWREYLRNESASSPINLGPLVDFVSETLAAKLPFPNQDEREIKKLAAQAILSWIEKSEAKKRRTGIHLNLDRNLLFDEVVLGPTQQNWLTLVKKLMARYEMTQEVCQSKLTYKEVDFC
jgi:hypothetical protein